MKKTLAARLVVGALAVIAAGGVMAGQIQSSGTKIAREAITKDSQTMYGPNIAYRFQGDVNAKNQDERFQVQLQIGQKAKWVSASAAANMNSINILSTVDTVNWVRYVNAAAYDTAKTVLETAANARIIADFAAGPPAGPLVAHAAVDAYTQAEVDSPSAAQAAALAAFKAAFNATNFVTYWTPAAADVAAFNALRIGYVVTDMGVAQRDDLAVSSPSDTLWASILVPQLNSWVFTNAKGAKINIPFPNELLKKSVMQQPLFSFNSSAVTVDNVQLTNLFTNTVQAITECDKADKELPVKVYHFANPTNPAAIVKAPGGSEDEHNRNGNNSEGTLIKFPVNIGVTVTASTGVATLAPGAKSFSGVAPDPTFEYARNIKLGSFNLDQLTEAYDSDAKHKYLLKTVAASGLRGIGAAATEVGEVETKQIEVVVSASQGFSENGILYLVNKGTCASASGTPYVGVPETLQTGAGDHRVDITAANKAGPIKLVINTSKIDVLPAVMGATGAGPITICYQVSGVDDIPNSAFSATARVVKAPAGNHEEQDNFCKGPLYGLSGGIKIDVRNYASSKEVASSRIQSVIRLINNSDSTPARVFAQLIHQDGKLGGWGEIANLPVRGVKNMTAEQIEALLVNDATKAIGPKAAVISTGVADKDYPSAPRLRITSDNGATLRVQNYLWNVDTQQIYEASASQGVDFEGAVNGRVPVLGEPNAQPISQDAQSGLNLGK